MPTDKPEVEPATATNVPRLPSGKPFHWNELDHGLVSLKLVGLSEDIRRSIEADEKRIRFENRNNGNAATIPSQLLQMQEQRTDEWVRRTYEIYCDVWKVQGHTKSADFIRAVSDQGIVTLIHARTSAVIGEFELFAKRTTYPIEQIKAQLDGFRRSMQRLESRWKRKLEIEAKECEHAQGFHQNKSHETTSDKIRRQGDELFFGVISIRRDQIPQIRRGELETLAAPWMGATRERLHDFLDEFYQYIIEVEGVSEAEALSEYNGAYPSYADSSAWLKTRLERLQRSVLFASLLSQDRSAKRSNTSASPNTFSSQQTSAEDREGNATRSSRGRPKDRISRTRQQVIRRIAATGVTGEAYCMALQAAGLSTPVSWQKNESCPKSYSETYRHSDPIERKKWRNRIADEKYKATRISHSPKLAVSE